MAKSPVNKSQAIRDAMAANPSKTPSEIAEMLKEQGIKVSGQYVSTIKSNAAKKSRGGRRAGRRGKNGRAATAGFAAVGPALEFVRAAGGLEAAKAALGALEEIGNVVR